MQTESNESTALPDDENPQDLADPLGGDIDATRESVIAAASSDYLDTSEIQKLRSEEERIGSFNGRRYTVDGDELILLFKPILVEDIKSDEHKEKILRVLRQKTDGEIAAFETLMVNVLREQAKIAKRFGVPKESLYLSMKLDYTSQATGILMSNFGDIFMQTLAKHVDYLKERGATDQQVITELAGHVFHEAVHQGEEGLDGALLEGRTALCEVTTITSQLAYYLSERYTGPKSYDARRCKAGTKKIKDGGDNLLDHDIATTISYDLLFQQLKTDFPDIAVEVEGLDPPAGCERIAELIPSERDGELMSSFRSAIAESTKKEVSASIIDKLSNP